jgi:alkylhydroperoxidase family enzyme
VTRITAVDLSHSAGPGGHSGVAHTTGKEITMVAEQGTRIADAAAGVTDEAWANAAKHHDDDQLAALVALVAVINTYNRVNVILRRPGGDYQPGQWG